MILIPRPENQNMLYIYHVPVKLAFTSLEKRGVWNSEIERIYEI